MPSRILTLSFPLAVAFALLACPSPSTPADQSRPRPRPTNEAILDSALAPAQPETGTKAAFCSERQQPTRFVFPPLADGSIPRGNTWRWINLWASWCAPCILEIPTIAALEARLHEHHHAVAVVHLALDTDEQALERLRQRRSDVPATLRVRDAEALAEWLPTVGLSGSDTLPLHVFVDAQDQVRCLHRGLVHENDYDNIAAIVATHESTSNASEPRLPAHDGQVTE